MTIRTEHLRKVYKTRDGTLAALDDISLEVDSGKCLVIVGPSGSGKSTLLNVVGTLTAPTGGHVFLDGTDVYALSRGERARLRAKKIGFVFQKFHLIPYLTAEENVRVSLAFRGGAAAATSAAARAWLEQVGLAARAAHLPDQLSVGEQQRVALARAAAGEPRIVLADEPTGNLDPRSAEIVIGYLGRFRDNGAAVAIVTHDPRLESIADCTLKLDAGRLERPTAGATP